MADLASTTISIRSNLSEDELKEYSGFTSQVMIDDYLGIGAVNELLVDAIDGNSVAIEDLTARVVQLEIDVEALEIRVDNLEILVNYNFQYLHGDAAYSPDYDEAAGYTKFDKVTYSGNEYSAINDIGPPAGAFNPSLWRQVSTQANHDFINQTRSDATAVFCYAAYGGIYLDTPPVSFSDIDGTWQTVDVFDTVSFTTPRGIIQNVTNSSLAFDEEGVYEVVFSFAIEHNEDNAGRTTNVRLYNLTDAAPTATLIPVFIGRNQPGTNFSYSFPFELNDPLGIGKEFVIQIGGGDTLTSVSFENAEYYIKSIGEYRGEL